MPVKPRSKTRISRSKLYKKILEFFMENEGSIDTPRGIATWISESLASVRTALEELTEMECLKAHRTSSTIGYSCLLSEKDMAALILKPKSRK